MAKKPVLASLLSQPRVKIIVSSISNVPANTKLTILLGSVLALGVLILGIVSVTSWNWLRTSLGASNTNASQSEMSVVDVQRTASYADLTFTILNVQSASSFSDDKIRLGAEIVRLNMRVTNTTPDSIAVVYYDITRLLAPKLDPIAPTNVHLSAALNAHSSITGWLDFPIANKIQLSTLKMQLGSIRGSETLVTIPFSGPYDPGRYAHTLFPQSVSMSYNFGGHVLTFQLTSVDVRYGYRGTQCRAGQKFYILNFLVNNKNTMDISPGTGFDYVRIALHGEKSPPIDSSLPPTFKAGAKSVGGRVAFALPQGIKRLTIAFLLQVVPGEQDITVTL